MKIIDKYIIKELILPFSSGIIAFTIIIFGSTILFPLISNAIKYNILFTDILALIVLQLPHIIGLSIPMATLFSTISLFGKLTNNLEIIALRANGISVIRVITPVIVTGVCISIGMLFFSEFIIPKSSTIAENVMQSYKTKKTPKIQENINLTQYKNKLPHRIINIREKKDFNLKNITIAEYEDGNLNRLIRADSGSWMPEGSWEFNNGIMHFFNKDSKKKITVIEFKKERINLNLKPKELSNKKKSIEQMNRKEVLEEITIMKSLGQDPVKLLMDFHIKIAIAFSPLIYCLLGAAMGLRPHRNSSAMGIGLSLIIIFGYIILMSLGMALGLSKTIPPLYAAWTPNIITLLISLYLVKRLATN